MTTSFMRGCHRCGGGPPLVTRSQFKPLGWDETIEERVILCQACRMKASKENQAAKRRSKGGDPQ